MWDAGFRAESDGRVLRRSASALAREILAAWSSEYIKARLPRHWPRPTGDIYESTSERTPKGVLVGSSLLRITSGYRALRHRNIPQDRRQDVLDIISPAHVAGARL